MSALFSLAGKRRRSAFGWYSYPCRAENISMYRREGK